MTSGKVCTRCLVEKDLASFNKMAAVKSGYRASCKPCQSADYQRYKNSNPAQYRALKRASKYRIRFNIPIAEVDARFAAAGHRCEACGTQKADTPNRALVLDHDHSCCPREKTVLCTKCNVALGALGDQQEKVDGLASYLRSRSNV